MKKIDKSTHRAEFNIYTTTYLEETQQPTGEFLPELNSNDSYKEFRSRYKYNNINNSRYNGWLEILKHEQEQNGICRCCYCMHELHTGQEISVEHLIPRNFDRLNEQDEYNFYCSKAPELQNNVILSSEFDNDSRNTRIDVSQIQRMPHHIAHSNLFVACCRGDELGCSCNYNRENKRILPLMLMDDVEEKVKYKKNGEVQILYSDTQSVYKTETNLKINRTALVQIRRLWYLFSRKQIKPTSQDSSTEAEMKSFIENAFDGNVDPQYEQYYRNDYYRKLVPEYNWFYDYYTKKYPLQQYI